MTGLSGSYAFAGSGYALSSSFVSDVRTISGVLQFDGMGTLTTTWNSTTGTGTYTVMPSCTGSAAVQDSAGNTWNLQFTLTADSGFIVSVTTPVLMFSGAARPMQATAPACSNATLNGPFNLHLNGRQMNVSGALASTFQAVGSATFDGSGNVTFGLTANSNQFRGRLETMTGTYSLDETCTGTVDIASGDTASFTLVADGDGQSFYDQRRGWDLRAVRRRQRTGILHHQHRRRPIRLQRQRRRVRLRLDRRIRQRVRRPRL